MRELKKLRENGEKGTIMVLVVQRVAPKVVLKVNRIIMEFFSCFFCWVFCFSKDGGLQEEVKIRVGCWT